MKDVTDLVKKEGISVRGITVTGKVVSTRMKRTITVEREIVKFIKKYKRWSTIKSKIHVHLPKGVKVKLGDMVLVGQTRKLSKTKNWVLLKILSGGDAE